MVMRKSNKNIFIKLIILFILIVLLYFTLLKREHRYWKGYSQLSTGDKIDVFIDYSTTPVLYGGHGFMIGAYFPQFSISFNYHNKNYIWNINSFIEPILINIYQNTFYLLINDWHEKKGTTLKFYKFNSFWERLDSNSFPKKIIIQNIFYLGGKDIKESTLEMNPESECFRYSCLTPKLWLELEKGIKLYEWKKNDEVKKDFIIDYKKKYLGLSEKGTYSDIVFDEKIR